MATVRSGDIVQGKAVIEQLDVRDLQAGTHQFWFQASSNAIAQHYLLPVTVFKGEVEGPRVMITAGVHGDELNGVLASHQLIRALEKVTIKGTITIVSMINLPGMLNHSRDFHSSDPDASPSNLNRFFPGNATGDAANRLIDSVWSKLLKSNADCAIDLHTQTSGAVYPLYVFADFRLPEALHMARLMNPDCILDDPGDAGVLETTWNQSLVPSITVEVGMGKVTQQGLIDRSVDGMQNILKYIGVIDGQPSAPTLECKEGKTITSIRARQGGFVLPQVELLSDVKAGDVVALQYDAFGQLIETYSAPNEGKVLSFNVDSMREPGALVVRLISD
ncbi:succinylglutamate desuccinylase/aspartoacylase family protein [Vibrio agarivorans]|uniref:Succinylglutamate desuccinylase/aspartoacylase family protein n=1 Tax=Vibrio agarivorans TaxID=153622 RepID=A0ABT7Y6R6_9VIBR|nr:succinylglutamate desuccinylase/aspartoacylase family protein [Vibrio agarivorans]MDN2483748.1 succinylglutamate desuccinylase/aspartoacylase family protein [Vibrio agarivorans]